MANVVADSMDASIPAIAGMHAANGEGVSASSTAGIALRAVAQNDTGVFTTSVTGMGLDSRSEQGIAVRAIAQNDTGVFTTSASGMGLDARSDQGVAVQAISQNNTGVFTTSVMGRGLDARSSQGVGVYATGGAFAGFFEGVVMVTQDIQLQNADCAEEFDVAEAVTDVEPGTVMVLTGDGKLRPSESAYDKCVAGVISGAGAFKPGIVLDRKHHVAGRLPLALVGKVYCKVDAGYGAIAVGDLLTTSATPGHAMKAGDRWQAFGTVLGKALRAHSAGKGLIPVLVALQ